MRGNAHQVFDKYQALAREAAASGDRIQAEAYWQYADHYFRVIQTQGGFVPRNNWGDGGEDGQQNPQNPQDGQPQQPQANGGANGGGENYPSNDRQSDGRQVDGRQGDDRQGEGRQNDGRQSDNRQNDSRQNDSRQSDNRQNEGRQNDGRQYEGRKSEGRQSNDRQSDNRVEHEAEEPGLGGVAFLQSGRSAPSSQDPAAEDQPEVPEFRPAGRRGGGGSGA